MIFTIRDSIIHNGKLLKCGDEIDINDATADRLEKVGGIVKRKETLIKELLEKKKFFKETKDKYEENDIDRKLLNIKYNINLNENGGESNGGNVKDIGKA